MKLKTGTIIDGYQILAEAGSGACGTVYRAANLISNEIVALKVIPCQGSLPERELNALKLYQKLEHPHLIRVRHIGTYEDYVYYTMDWCESSLARRKVPADELLEIAEEIADALNLLHQKGLLHRDIKPDNIFFRQGKAVLGDVGLLTNLSTATFAGSPGFLAPSLLQGHAPDMYSDCYALAKTIYCALSGQEPAQFPVYEGDLTPAASKLMQCVLSVCGVEPKIRTAEGILEFLEKQTVRTPVLRKKKIAISFFALFVIMILAGAIILFYPRIEQIKPESEQAPVKKIEPDEKIIIPEIYASKTITEHKPVEKRMISEPHIVMQKTSVPEKTKKNPPSIQRKTEKRNTSVPAQPGLPPDLHKKMNVIQEMQDFFKLFPKGNMSVYTLQEEIKKEFPEYQLNKKQEAEWEKIYWKWHQDSMVCKRKALDESKRTGESILSIWERQKPQDSVTQFFLTYYADMEAAYNKQNHVLLSPEERRPLHEEYKKKLAVFIRERSRLLDQNK